MLKQTKENPILAIERVIDKRLQRGASDKSIVEYLNHLKTVWKSRYMEMQLDDLISAVRQTPINQ
jgi:hypothetical protein